jgi:uncharacterized glyoxalase superfamily protein PhnB
MAMSVMTNLYTADVERAVAFYRDQLGGSETFRAPAEGQPSHVELRVGDVTIAISSRDAVVSQGLPEPTAGHPMELVVWVDWTDQTVASLRAAGAPVLISAHEMNPLLPGQQPCTLGISAANAAAHPEDLAHRTTRGFGSERPQYPMKSSRRCE